MPPWLRWAGAPRPGAPGFRRCGWWGQVARRGRPCAGTVRVAEGIHTRASRGLSSFWDLSQFFENLDKAGKSARSGRNPWPIRRWVNSIAPHPPIGTVR